MTLFFAKNPIAKGKPSNQDEINSAEKELGLKFDKDYSFFLLSYGGCMIKAQEVYGLANSELMDETDIIELTELYREDEDGNKDWLTIGTDYSGSSIGINKKGNVVVYDHDLEEQVILSDTFEAYILKALSEES